MNKKTELLPTLKDMESKEKNNHSNLNKTHQLQKAKVKVRVMNKKTELLPTLKDM